MIVHVNKDKLVKILSDNKKSHIEEYKKQLEAWKEAYETYTDKLNEWSKNPEEDKPKEPYKPVDYTSQYDEALVKLSHHVKDSVGLDDYEFDNYVKDEFGWKQGFLQTSSFYNVHR